MRDYIANSRMGPYGDGTAYSDVAHVAVTTSSVLSEIPSGWKNRYVTLKALGGDVDYLFTVSGGSVSNAAPSSGLERGTDHGDRIKDGNSEDVIVPPAATHVAVQGSATCTLIMRVSSPSTR